jgi:hypothetical protein
MMTRGSLVEVADVFRDDVPVVVRATDRDFGKGVAWVWPVHADASRVTTDRAAVKLKGGRIRSSFAAPPERRFSFSRL